MTSCGVFIYSSVTNWPNKICVDRKDSLKV